MGTRHLIKVISDGKTVVAQYGQWDGYPSGQGITLLSFLRKFKGNYKRLKDRLKDRLKTVHFAGPKEEKEMNDYYISIGVNDGWMSMDQSAKFNQKYPLLSRDNGAGVLQMIMDSNVKFPFLIDSSSFGEGDDGGFGCEYKYIVDLDKNTLKCYAGTSENDLLKTYPLDKLPTQKLFLNELEKIEEEKYN